MASCYANPSWNPRANTALSTPGFAARLVHRRETEVLTDTMAAATGDRKRRKDVRPARFLASPPLLLLSLLLASAPDGGGSFLYPIGRSGGYDGRGGATLTASRDRRGGGGYNFSRGRAGGGVVAIVVGGTAKKTGGVGAGGGGGGGGLAGAKRGRGSSSMGMPSDERRGVPGAKKVSEGRAWVVKARAGGGIHMNSSRDRKCGCT